QSAIAQPRGQQPQRSGQHLHHRNATAARLSFCSRAASALKAADANGSLLTWGVGVNVAPHGPYTPEIGRVNSGYSVITDEPRIQLHGSHPLPHGTGRDVPIHSITWSSLGSMVRHGSRVCVRDAKKVNDGLGGTRWQ